MKLNWNSLDDEKRRLRIEVAGLKRAKAAQKQARKKAEAEVKKWKREYQKIEKEKEKLQEKLEEMERQRNQYRDMLFKKNKAKKKKSSTGDENSREKVEGSNKRGAKKGHPGHTRKRPKSADKTWRIFATHCPDCNHPLSRADSTQNHWLEDIPDLDKLLALSFCYQLERQWCTHCQREVVTQPSWVIPHARFGLNTTAYLLYLRYRLGMTLYKMVDQMSTTFGIKLTPGGIVSQLHRTKKWLGPEYDRLLEIIRTSKIKHADETGWRIDGINAWMWGFMNKDTVYLSAEESRGKGVATDKLGNYHPDDVLVRDDYGAYQKLNLKHQSCWAHLIRKSREAAGREQASEEVKGLHQELKSFYAKLKEITSSPYNAGQRQSNYREMKLKLQAIINTQYQEKDTLRIQTRISNQNTNLITAILYDGVPLTNNLAERMLRPLVITRKLTGGSRSHKGATTHATNMSIVQTIQLQSQPLIPTLKSLLYQGATGKR